MAIRTRFGAGLDAGFLLQSLPFFALIVLAAAISYRYHTLLRDQRDRVDHTYRVVTRLESTLVGLIDAETGQRGYVITGDPRYLQPYRRASSEAPTAIAGLRGDLADSPVQLARVDQLVQVTNAKFDELQETIDARDRKGLDAARAMIVRDRGRQTMDAVRAVVATMKGHEVALLAERSAEVRATERRLLATTLLCTCLSLIARVGLAWLARRRTRSLVQ